MNKSIIAATSFAAGLIFALGLGVSGMTDPLRVLGFLNLTGAWDHRLALVMVGALAIYTPAHWLYRRRGSSPMLGTDCQIPSSGKVDVQLVLGATLFGIGWGLGGYCPGPALTSLAAAGPEIAVFVTMMVLGIVVGRRLTL